MKVLLLNPPMDVRKSLGKYKELMEPMPCVGLAYIAAVLRENGIDVSVLDGFAQGFDLEDIKERVRRKNPDVVGISCLTPAAKSTYEICSGIKEVNEDIFIILGNLHAEVFAEDIVEEGIADAVVKGEGEYSTLELVKALEGNGDISEVEGLFLKKGGEVIYTGDREPIDDLDKLPYPAWDLFPYEKYGGLPFTDIKKPMLGVLTSRGCPYNCTFCSARNSGFRKRDPVKVVDEMEFLIEEYDAQQITFMDLIFPVSKDYGMQICDEIRNRNLNEKIVWAAETRVDVADRELFRNMQKSGCQKVMFGIESGSQEILDRINKNITLEEVRDAVNKANETGLETVGFFMIGLPGEDRKKIRKTIDFSNSLHLDFTKFAIFIPFPGCEIFDNLVEKGRLDIKEIRKNDWIRFSPHNPNPGSLPYVPENLTEEELLELKDEATSSFYLNPRNIFNILFKKRSVPLRDLIEGGKILVTNYLREKMSRFL